MAEKRVIELEIKTDKANKAINDLNKSTTDLAASFEDVYGEMQPLSGRMGELEDRLYELALAGKQNTQEYKDLQSEVSRFKRVIMETDMAVDGASGTMSQKLSGALGGITSAFELGQGVMASFGVESAEVEEALLKVQSAMAISQGFAGLKEASNSFKALGKDASDAFGKMTTAGKAFAVTGIGLLLTGVGLLIANFDKLKETFSTTSQAQKDLASTMDAYKEGATEAIKQTTEVGNAFDLARQGVISKDEALHLYNETLGDSFGKAKNLNEAERLYAAKTDAYIKSTALRAQAQALFAKAAEEQVKGLTANMEDQTSIFDKAKAGIYSYFGGVKQGADELLKAQKDGEKQTKKTADARAKQLNDLAGSLLKEAELVENKNNIVSKNEKATIDAIKEARKAALEKAKEEWEKEKELGEKRIELGKKILEELAQLEENRKNKEAKIIAQSSITKEELYKREAERINKLREDEYKDAQGFLEAQIIQDQNNFSARLDLLELQRQKELENKELTEGEIAAIEAKYSAERKKISDEEKEYKRKNTEFALQSITQGMNVVNELASQTQQKYEALNKAVLDNDKLTDKEKQKLLDENNKRAKKAFEVQKAVSIASALIATYQSAVSAYQSQFLPLPDPSSPIRGAIAAGLAVAAGLANVKNIASQKFEGASLTPSSGSAGGSVPDGAGSTSAIAPNFNIVGNAQATNPLAGLGGQPLQAYVVSGEVTTAQSLDRNRVNYATFG